MREGNVVVGMDALYTASGKYDGGGWKTEVVSDCPTHQVQPHERIIVLHFLYMLILLS